MANSSPRFPLPGAPAGPDYHGAEAEFSDALRAWYDHYESTERQFVCGKCRHPFGFGAIHPSAPSITMDGCSHRAMRARDDGSRAKETIRGLIVRPGIQPDMHSLKHPRPSRWYWESSSYHTDKNAPHYGYLKGERQFTFECKCGLRRVVKNHRLVRAFCDALVTGREIVIGVDI